MERTLVIVKPDAVSKGQIGEIVERFEMICLSKEKAEGFYQVHRGRPFFESLTTFMSSGPSVAMVLEGEGAIAAVRKLIGATNPQEAEEGTIRRDLAMSIEQNVVHGSDSAQSASFEIPYFFSALELFSHQREA